ncbi:MAG: hypothetical protein JW806_08570 [Sedimentisphaerales bacterium]|nr:hypothetical protein [Sedimentisphaerales bacterium]
MKRCTVFTVIVLFTFILMGAYAQTAYGAKVCAMLNTSTEQLISYDTAGCNLAQGPSCLMGDVHLDMDPASGIIFALPVGGGDIKLLDANLVLLDEMDPICGGEGIIYDRGRKELYLLGGSVVYVYSWDISEIDWEPGAQDIYFNDPYYILSNIDGFTVTDMDFDIVEDILYVTDSTNTVKRYNVGAGFTYIDSIPVTRQAKLIDVYNDGNGVKYLYTGNQYTGCPSYLVQTVIIDVNTVVGSSEQDLCAGVMGSLGCFGIATNKSTGYVYVTQTTTTGAGFFRKMGVFAPGFPLDPNCSSVEGEGTDDYPSGAVCIGPDIDNLNPDECLFVGRTFVYDHPTAPLELTVTPAMFEKWLYLGRPESWCCTAQKVGNCNTAGPSCDRVDTMDLATLKHADTWFKEYDQPGYNPAADLNLSGRVDTTDLAILKSHWFADTGKCEQDDGGCE